MYHMVYQCVYFICLYCTVVVHVQYVTFMSSLINAVSFNAIIGQ